ncbi:MAG: MgtC/SapB family protein [bacterium]|jgi:putative Mg2+ transporter-C (MgtC) family protein|nr:MgtC/SapB family protein [Caldisericota bacterium]
MNLPWWEILLRLFLATLAGGIVGLEREITGKPAGLRTMILVSLGSGLFMILSITAFPSGSSDLGRIAAGVVTGIGFLGAGAIFREGVTIRGLTTAATIWVTCGLGLAIGAGLYLEALFGLIFAIIALVALHPVEESVPKQKLYRLSITLNPRPERLSDLFSYFREIGARIEEVEQEGAGGLWKISLVVPSKIKIEDLLKAMPEYAGSYAISLEQR